VICSRRSTSDAQSLPPLESGQTAARECGAVDRAIDSTLPRIRCPVPLSSAAYDSLGVIHMGNTPCLSSPPHPCAGPAILGCRAARGISYPKHRADPSFLPLWTPYRVLGLRRRRYSANSVGSSPRDGGGAAGADAAEGSLDRVCRLARSEEGVRGRWGAAGSARRYARAGASTSTIATRKIVAAAPAGRLTISVRPRMPATPRSSKANGTVSCA